MSPRVDCVSPNTPPLALMTNTLPLYMRMYGAALRSARTATEGSVRSTAGLPLVDVERRNPALSAQQPVQHGHLHDHAIEGFADHDAARPGEHFVGNRNVTPDRQAMHEVAVGPRAAEPAVLDTPVAKILAQTGFRLVVAVVLRRTPLLRIDDVRAFERF